MQKLIKFFKKKYLLLLVIILTIPTFYKMISMGIFSMQDFHIFRLYEFDKCFKAFQIPCRWAPDAGFGYGEPLFNFYGQMPYILGEFFLLLKFSLIDSIKILFALSFTISAVGMYLLSKKIWRNNFSATVSSILYLYAPYRAVDVWVRGALPESLSFAIFPFIILSIENKKFWQLTFLLALLISTHNLSVILFSLVTVAWILLRRFYKGFLSFVLAILISSFYILPVIFESKYITLATTINGYFDFRAHFITLKQMLFDLSWGYGGSTWGSEDGLNLSVGIVQWVVTLLVATYLILKRNIFKNKEFIALFFIGWFYLFLTHNKSAFLWEKLDFMSYIQFPWRFLGVAVFCFSLASGHLFSLLSKKFNYFVCLIVVGVTILLNFSFFKYDIWYKVSDSYFLQGEEWDRQRVASIGDYWPNFGHEMPTSPSDGTYINYFPGWKYEGEIKDGLIKSENSEFKNTPVRTIGNTISIVIICLSILISIYF